MMKKLFLFALPLMLLLGSCQNELEDQTLSNSLKVVSASIESQSSRLAVSYDNATNIFGLNWSEGDAFKVFGTNSTSAVYNWTSGNDFTLTGTIETPKYGIYPSSSNPGITDDKVTMTLSDTPSISNANLPMWAATENGTSYAFKHLAAGLRVAVNTIPAGYNTLTVEASNAISGEFTANLGDATPALTFNGTLEDSNKKVTVTFEAATDANTKNEVFYIPLPAGTYTTLKVTISDGSNTKELKNWSNLTIVRGKMYYTTAVVNASTIAAVNEALEDAGEVPVTVNMPDAIVASAGAIEIPDDAKEVTMNFAAAPTTSESTPLTINQNHEQETPGEATSELNINMPESSESLYADIVAPTTTVTLNGGKYTKVTATTATNTLIIKSNVEINSLIIKGGNVIIEEGAIVTNTSIPEGSTVTNKNVVKTVDELKAAISNASSSDIVTLGDDIGMSEILVINRSLVLDGNGHTLTSTAGRAINVSGANGVTIKNLTINASGERAINVIQNSTNVTIDKVTATASNYTINVASSAPSAKVTISNSTLNGKNVVNIASPSADITVSNSIINCNDDDITEGESYAALCLNKDAVGGKIAATGCTINVTAQSDSEKGRNGAENGSVTIDGSTDGVKVMYVVITYPDSNYYHAFETLAEAFEFAKDGDVITLIRNITLDGEWAPVGTTEAPFKGTFDGNGKTISGLTITSGNFAGLFGYVSDATIKNVTLANVNVSGSERMGALVGKIFGDAVVENCTVSGSVEGSDSNTGGIIGEIVTGTVQLTNLTNNATVTNTKTSNSRAGGVVGQVTTNANVTLTGCKNTGAITTVNGYAGGIVSAYQSGTLTIENCSNTGTLDGQYKGNMLGWYTSVRSITISTESNAFDINAIGCVDIAISSNMSLYGKNYFVNRKADLTGVESTAQTFSTIFADDQIGTSPKALWDKLIAFYSHALETNSNFAGYPKDYWAMFNQTAGYPSDGAWDSYFNSYNSKVNESMKLTKEEFSSASWRGNIVYLAPEE